ncbi:MAG: glycosyltransferase [Pseudomonas proteolytica]|uniref:glycosyltransferase n=1 Tax=Pseudomonas proteolytica TaxID=219574 RepID=UPI003F37A8A5
MNSVSSQLSAKPLLFPLPGTHPPQSLSRQKREAPAPAESAEGSRLQGDRELAMEYHSALLKLANGEKDVTINAIAPDSTFGQWWAHLRDTFKSPEVRQWMEDQGINPGSITLNLQSGEISFKRRRHLDPEQKQHTLGPGDRRWGAISGPILEAARVVTAGHADTTFAPPYSDLDEPVPSWLVGRFYNEPQHLTGPAIRQRAADIARVQGFAKLDPAVSASLITSRSEDSLQVQKAYLGDVHNRSLAAGQLRHLAASIKDAPHTAEPIRQALHKSTIELSFDSSYQPANAGPWNSVSLLKFLEDHGWDIPTNHEQLENLATALSTPAPKSPISGNLGGALAWPAPLDPSNQAQLRADVRAGKFGAITLTPFDSVLDYLLNNRTITPEELRNPRALIDSLVNSPRGQELGSAIASTFQARNVKGSANDWLLAALNVEIGSSAGEPTDSRGQIAGYQLVSPANTGKSGATITKELAAHLLDTGRASSPEKAALQAHLLLANQAPAFLVQDIPSQVVVGTHSWVSFVTATARLEAKAPGVTATMSYAQIMLEAGTAPITDQERQVEYAAQNEAIKQWGVANGMAYPVAQAAVDSVRGAFTAQIRELREVSESPLGEMPTTKAFALQALKKALPDMDPKLFEKKCIESQPSSIHFPGPYSILDLYIDGRAFQGAPDSADGWGERGRAFVKVITAGQVHIERDGQPATWVSSSAAININEIIPTLKDLPRPLERFKTSFDEYAATVKKATGAQLKMLISKLPLEDRENLEFGKITIRKEIRYNRADHPIRVAPGVLLVETERNGKIMTYAIDRLQGTVIRQPHQQYKEFEPSSGFMHSSGGKRFDAVKPAGQYSSGITDENTAAQGAPNSFASPRTQYIADAVIEDMDLPAVERHARGATTFETEVPTYKVVEEIALSLIPFRSAIKNFIDGKIGDGIVDLAFDIFGFAVGLGAAAKGAKALAVGASALSKVGRVGKIVGRAAVGALNPLGGVDDLARGVVNLGRTAYKGVKSLRGAYRSVNLLELAKKPDLAEGTYKAANSAQETRTLAKFDEATHKWYAFDPRTRQAYGKALDQFSVAPPTLSDANSLSAIASNDGVKAASQQHGLAATGTFKVGTETVEGNVVMFQGNWHQYDPLKKRAFGPPLKEFKPAQVAANGEVRSLNRDLSGYEAKYISPDELQPKGLQGNVYVGRSNKEYVRVDGVLYESRVTEGQRVIRHAAGAGPDIPVKELGVAGWEPLSRGNRLVGGAGSAPTPWKLDYSTYVVPMDDIKVSSQSTSPYAVNYKGVDHSVRFDSSAGAWKATNVSTGIEGHDPLYFWRSGKNKWQRGTFNELKTAKQADAHRFQFVDVASPTVVGIPKDIKPLPKELHYFWAGQDIPPNMTQNMTDNALKAPGYKSVLHVDADNPAIFQKIKTDLERKAPGMSVVNLNEDEVFKQMKNSEMYDYFRQGQGKNLAAASDVARYPIMNKYGGIYLDTDDLIQANVGGVALSAGANDILLNTPVAHNLTDYKSFYNTSNFATQPGNPVINDMIAEMHKRFADNKAYFKANRPTVTKTADGQIEYTPEFEAYERKVFDTVGPNLFNDTLKSKRPDMYELGFDERAKEAKVVDGQLVASGPTVDILASVRKQFESKGITPPDLLDLQLQKTKEHYLPLLHQFKIKIGAEHSWINA